MGTIISRLRSDGSTAYTAQIRIRRGGKILFSQAQTFDRMSAARTWMERKENELDEPGGIDRATAKGETVADLISAYIRDSRKEIGRTKEQVLGSLKNFDIASKAARDLRPEDIVALARDLGMGGRKPQTVQNYLSHLSAVFRVARAAWGAQIDRAVIADATDAVRHLGLAKKSERRERRPSRDELDRLVKHFLDRSRRRNALPMNVVMAFAAYSARRQEEITRLLWSDLEPGRILVRDMKHPGEKAGNHVWCALVPEAEAIARSMPKVAPEIFPFTTDAISAAFTRACKILGIKDLHFHDLRHEGASRLFEMGWTIPRVAEVTGHRSWQSLQRYSHLRQTGDKLSGWDWTHPASS